MNEADSSTKHAAEVGALGDTREVIEQLRKRVRKLEQAAGGTLFSISLLIVSGSLAFITAGSIVAAEQVDYYREAKSIEQKLTASQEQLQTVASQFKETKSITPGLIEEIRRQNGKLDELGLSIRQLETSLPDNPKAAEDAHQRLLVSSVTTRVAIGSLLAFLVVVLVNLYRYNVRLAAFYSSRIDALLLAAHMGIGSLEKTSKLLSPDALDIDKMPDTPAKQVIDLLKQVGSISKNRNG